MSLTHVSISGLHGMRTVEIPFRGAHCVLVGPNGSGKSTALQIIAYSLGRRWDQLSELQFTEVSLTFSNGQTTTVRHSDCPLFATLARRSETLSKGVWTTQLDLLSDLSASMREEILRASDVRFIDPGVFRNRSKASASADEKAAQKRMSDILETLNSSFTAPIIYLPTYRRIELELRKLIENLPDSAKRNIENKKLSHQSNFITEIVRFGMDDVKQRISKFESSTRDLARDLFNRMMASYIKEMANSQVISVTELRDIYVDRNQIEITLSRIEEGLLNEEEKSQVSDIIMELVEGRAGGHPAFYKKWLAHFYSRLYSVNQQLEGMERPIRMLVETLNRYLFPKKVDYDIEKYHFSIKDEYDREILLGDLSSGEKQIVSIMAELFFREEDFSIFIDEPELSLSVPWQIDFLADIAKSPHCKQVIAVTHSPFIYDNSFSNSVVDFAPAR